MNKLRIKNRSYQVKLLQRLLNIYNRRQTLNVKRQTRKQKLEEDGTFGTRTYKAVRNFQRAKHLKVNGIVDGLTWKALGLSIEISHDIKLIGQPTGMTCWSAAVAMLLGLDNRSVGSGFAATSTNFLTYGGLISSNLNVERFATYYGLKFNSNQSWSIDKIVKVMKEKPLWVAGLVPSGHAVVYGGICGNGTAEGTMIQIYDPWPPNQGKIHFELYDDWLTKHPQATLYILHE